MANTKEAKLLLRELPFYGSNHIEFNNTLSCNHKNIRELKKLFSIYDIDLFNLTSAQFSDINPDHIFGKQRIRTRYYSQNNFKRLKSTSSTYSSFSLFHNNIRSLKCNLENLQVQLLSELDTTLILLVLLRLK